MILCEGLEKRFKEVVAVDGVSFQARDGEITGLLGPNGAGKTTALRILTGLVKADGGRSSVDGLDVAADPLAVRRTLAVLPDATGLYPRLTAREHIRYYGELHGLPRTVREARIEGLLDLLDMRAIADRRADGFSQGERMKVALARALVHEPKNLVLDEPTNGLDVMSTRSVRELLRRLREQGRCILFSSHVMQEVAALCDRIVVIAQGRVVAEGTPEEIRARTGEATLEDAFVSVTGGEEKVA